MTKTNKSANRSNLIRRIKKNLSKSRKDKFPPYDPDGLSVLVDQTNQPVPPYYSSDLTNILFLSKRGLSRAPLAREIMRHLLHFSDHFGSIRPSARGISDAYESCPFDKRMAHYARKFGYELSGNSRRVNMGELSSANLIVTLDWESENFIKSRKFYIRGEVRPIGMFLPSDGVCYIADPFDREHSSDPNSNYEEIIRSVEFGCGNLLKFLPSII